MCTVVEILDMCCTVYSVQECQLQNLLASLSSGDDSMMA